MLSERSIINGETKVDEAIRVIKENEPDEGYQLAFSGGKDSIVIYRLAEMAGVKFTAHYSLTTVDPPELVRFVKKEYPDVKIKKPNITMWKLIEKHNGIYPYRNIRYCCKALKEHSFSNEYEHTIIMMGVRWAESPRRRKLWDFVKLGINGMENITFVNPIIDWSNAEVWEFIRGNNMEYCKLYDEGWKRLGCVLCPMQTTRMKIRDIQRYPQIARAYYNASIRGRELRRKKGLPPLNCTPFEYFVSWIVGIKPTENWDEYLEIIKEAIFCGNKS